MTPEDLLTILAQMSPEQRQMLSETVAPQTKYQRLRNALTNVENDANAGMARVRDLINRNRQVIEGTNYDLYSDDLIPTRKDIIRHFTGLTDEELVQLFST